MSVQAAMDEAIRKLGGVARLGARLGVAHSTVVRWRQSGRPPAARVAEIEAATGVARHRLRPDVFAAAKPAAPAEADLHAQAAALDLNPQAIAENALRQAISAEKARRWLEENREAIEAHNRWVEQHGLPLAEYRTF
jgi:post-segregation antitoxin (ccd killing protein)